ncbi:MAG: alkaline phosphatase family protein [Caldivirga sp.]|uniref:alkaline phosphatase family protein n=1 Tax=Caldivirga sp. TaxID=2080243 RepID=UPI003D12EC6B
MARASRLLFIGLDAFEPLVMLKLVDEGLLPNFSRLLKESSFTLAYSSPPCDTPTNWTTIMTGSFTGTHGMTSFFAHKPHGELNEGFSTLDSKVCESEFLWNVLEDYGKRVVIVNYPVAWPPTIKRGIVIGGPAPGASPWRVKWPMVYSNNCLTRDLNRCSPITIKEAEDWVNAPNSRSKPLEFEFTLIGEGPTAEQTPGWFIRPGAKLTNAPRYHALIIDSSGAGYDTVIVSRLRDASSPIATLKPGDWSGWIRDNVTVGDSSYEVAFRLKLVKLSNDAGLIELYRSDVVLTSGWSAPVDLSGEITDALGPYVEGVECQPELSSIREDVLGDDYFSIWLENIKYSIGWYSGLAKLLKDRFNWDAFIMHYHLHDSVNHRFLGLLYDKHPGYNAGYASRLWGFYREVYRLTDDFIGEMIKYVDEDTLIVLASDHGQVPAWRFVWIGDALIKRGLLAYRPEGDYYVVDWSRTMAYPFGHTTPYIFINLKDRDPHGIVDPRDYDAVRDEVIEALYSIRDPENGEHPVALALKKEDAEFLGQWGERVGDVLYFLKPGYGNVVFDFSRVHKRIVDGPIVRPLSDMGFWTALHHDYLPNAQVGLFTNEAFILMKGPGIRKGFRRSRPVWLTDLAPTIAHLMGVRLPKNSEGGVIAEFIEY